MIKYFKKLIAVFLVAIMLLPAIPVFEVSAEEYDIINCEFCYDFSSYVLETCSSSCSDNPGEIGHIWYPWEIIEQATYTKTGLKKHTCSVCGAVEFEIIPIADHTHTYKLTKTVPASCTVDGLKTYTCSICGDKYYEIIAHRDHSYVKHTVEPTCTEDGYIYYTCNNCDGHFSTSAVTPATGHSFGEWKVTKEATTTSTGLKERKCSKCGYAEQIIIEKIQPKIYKVTFDNQGADHLLYFQ